MIHKAFEIFPLRVWITLWATALKWPETLTAPCLGKDCPLFWQSATLNEINELAAFRGNPMLHRSDLCGV
jgi:hypothetical protein